MIKQRFITLCTGMNELFWSKDQGTYQKGMQMKRFDNFFKRNNINTQRENIRSKEQKLIKRAICALNLVVNTLEQWE